MFCDVKVYAFVLVAALTGVSGAPADSENANPIFSDPCVKNCAITYDYTPSCGSDNQDYSSKSFYPCFQGCGISITKAHDGRCNRSLTPSNENSDTCMRNCPVTADYNPFCGSDGKTHATKGLLNCYNRCGIDITMVSNGECKN